MSKALIGEDFVANLGDGVKVFYGGYYPTGNGHHRHRLVLRGPGKETVVESPVVDELIPTKEDLERAWKALALGASPKRGLFKLCLDLREAKRKMLHNTRAVRGAKKLVSQLVRDYIEWGLDKRLEQFRERYDGELEEGSIEETARMMKVAAEDFFEFAKRRIDATPIED